MTMAPSSSKTMDSNKVLEGSPDYRNQLGLRGSTGFSHQYCPQRQHSPQISTWLQMSTQIINIHMALSGNKGIGHQCML